MLDAVGIFPDAYRSLLMQLIFGSQLISEILLWSLATFIRPSGPFLLVIGGPLQGRRFCRNRIQATDWLERCIHILPNCGHPCLTTIILFLQRVNIMVGNGEIILRATI
jgi:hypothetical protein